MKPHILLIGETVTLTHAVRPAELGEALHHAGYEVTLACDPRFDALIGPKPFRTIPLRSAIDANGGVDFLKRNLPLFDVPTLESYVREDIRLMRILEPRLVVGDMRQSLAVSARLTGVPYVNIINAHWSPWSEEKLRIVNNPLSGIMGREAADSLFDMLSPVGSLMMSAPLNMTRLNHGMPPLGLGMKETFTAGDYVVYPDIPELNQTRSLPAEHRYIGHIDWAPDVPQPPWWDSLPAGKPIVYVNLGSSGEPALLDTILEALASLPVSILVGTTGRVAVSVAAPNVFVADYIPGDAAARKAVLVICNGGASTGYQSLAAGAPFLGVPSNADQLIFCRLASRAGAAECLMESEVTVAGLRYAASRMLEEPSYRAAAKAFAGNLAAYDPKARFVSFVSDILAGAVNGAG